MKDPREELTKTLAVGKRFLTPIYLVILQSEPDSFQISYSGGEMLRLNYQELERSPR